VAGFGVPSDIFARYQRLAGNDVLMVSGTDEHGTPITVAAEAEGVEPRVLVDRYNRLIAEDLLNLGLSYDLFTRTTTSNHYSVVKDLFETLYAKGYLIPKTTMGAFSAKSGRTLPDRYIEGTCPICGYQSARGDQCDNCGNQLDPTDLIDARSRIDGEPPVFRETEHFFLDLPAFSDELDKWIRKHSDWRTNVREFSLNLLSNLRPRPITRDLDWGVPLPIKDIKDWSDKRIYVWFDAVIGYLSASIEWANLVGDRDRWRDWWQSESARHAYFMGKDNIVFHSVIWPAILLGVGNDGRTVGGVGQPLHLPDDIISSEFLTMEGKRFSASRGVGIEVRDFLSRYDADALRYYLTVAGPETADTDFTWAAFVQRNNDELVANWGNLVNRALGFAHRQFGSVPVPGSLTTRDSELLETIAGGYAVVGEELDHGRFRAGVQEAMRLSAQVNRYLGDQEPWKLIDDDRERAGTITWVALQCLADLRLIMAPFLPFSSEKVNRWLGFESPIAPMPFFDEAADDDGTHHSVLRGRYMTEVTWGPQRLAPGTPIAKPEVLFAKLEPSVVDEELSRMEERAERPS
jgi:methionyl-tRNA synthetase